MKPSPLSTYLQLKKKLPQSGKHILANYDEQALTVYQAYNHRIALYAITHQSFGGDFKMDRMTWIKPNFLWMMYRSGWGTKSNQERILAIRLKRAGFEQILRQAVYSSYQTSYETKEHWKELLSHSDVRLQWDPDRDPYGNKIDRRAIQLGLKRKALRSYVRDWILSIEDISEFVTKQREFVNSKRLEYLTVPYESIYLPTDLTIRKKIGIE